MSRYQTSHYYSTSKSVSYKQDELLGNNTTDHFEKLNMLWLRALRLGVKISETALKEYLHDQTFLLRVASDEYFCADETTDETQKWELLERSVKGYLYCAVSDKL